MESLHSTRFTTRMSKQFVMAVRHSIRRMATDGTREPVVPVARDAQLEFADAGGETARVAAEGRRPLPVVTVTASAATR